MVKTTQEENRQDWATENKRLAAVYEAAWAAATANVSQGIFTARNYASAIDAARAEFHRVRRLIEKGDGPERQKP